MELDIETERGIWRIEGAIHKGTGVMGCFGHEQFLFSFSFIY